MGEHLFSVGRRSKRGFKLIFCLFVTGVKIHYEHSVRLYPCVLGLTHDIPIIFTLW
jgi:hypothetical protein